MKLLITGGCGFIGSAVVRHLVRHTNHTAINVDKLTYAASEAALEEARGHPRHVLIQADIGDAVTTREVFATHQPDAVMHLAAESHVDRSIDGPTAFMQTNIIGTFTLLEEARRYYATLSAARRAAFRFHHISTDEVFGALGRTIHHSMRGPATIHGVPMPPARRLLTIWSAHGSTPTGCRSSLQHQQQLWPLAVSGEIIR